MRKLLKYIKLGWLAYFPLTRSNPYPIDPTQWKKNTIIYVAKCLRFDAVSVRMVFKYWENLNCVLYYQLLFSRGPLVELLISSNIARYAEFRCVTRVLTWLDDHLVPVPCSRADVFATEAVGIVEKRQLMKMLTSIVAYNEEEMNNEFKGKCSLRIVNFYVLICT